MACGRGRADRGASGRPAAARLKQRRRGGTASCSAARALPPAPHASSGDLDVRLAIEGAPPRLALRALLAARCRSKDICNALGGAFPASGRDGRRRSLLAQPRVACAAAAGAQGVGRAGLAGDTACRRRPVKRALDAAKALRRACSQPPGGCLDQAARIRAGVTRRRRAAGARSAARRTTPLFGPRPRRDRSCCRRLLCVAALPSGGVWRP
jgi:hypothetical protein